MNKICVIGVYFGRLPKYFSLWLKSCARNSTVDFLLFTDQNVVGLPNNVKRHSMTLPEMKRRAETVMGFSVSLDYPYKCCDYKVVYGLIFQDYVSEYEYWGHCDFDLIFGDLQSFFDKYDLKQYDRFLPLGHLSLYRNTYEVNHRFQCTGGLVNYKDVYSNDRSCAFDELPGMTAIYLKNNFPFFSEQIFVDVASIYRRYRMIEQKLLARKPQNYKFQIFFWESGKIYRAYWKRGKFHKEEYMYIHFKKRPDFNVSFPVDNTDAFYITNQGFVPKTGNVTLDDVKKYNPYPGFFCEEYERIRYTVYQYWQRLIGRIKRSRLKYGKR